MGTLKALSLILGHHNINRPFSLKIQMEALSAVQQALIEMLHRPSLRPPPTRRMRTKRQFVGKEPRSAFRNTVQKEWFLSCLNEYAKLAGIRQRAEPEATIYLSSARTPIDFYLCSHFAKSGLCSLVEFRHLAPRACALRHIHLLRVWNRLSRPLPLYRSSLRRTCLR